MLSLQNIEKQYGSKVLYNGVSLNINPGNRYGLIGINGAGKSVLLRLIAGEEGVDKGNVSIPSESTIGYLPQEAQATYNVSVMEMVLEPFKEVLDAEKAFEKIASIEDHESQEYKKAETELNRLQAEIDKHDAYSLPSRAASILAGLGVAQETWDNPVDDLSGGYRMRVLLARLLLLNPEFLLMDEPTNHLDMDSLIWLERFLQKFKGGMLIVSHDRDFLNRVITHTLEIDRGRIHSYTGNLKRYFEWKEQLDDSEEKRIKNLSEKIEKTERFIERFKSKATKASQARSRMKQLDKLKDELPEQIAAAKTFTFTLPPASACGSVPLKFEQITSGYGDKVVLNKVDLTITKGEKLAVIGPNGSGKSTLLKTITDRADVMGGEMIIGHNADIKYFSQHRLDELNPTMTLFDTVAAAMGAGNRKEVLSMLGAFLFRGDEVEKTVGVLSGGEKSRLSLLMLLVNPGNVLLLDEPTNHLDIQSIETVAHALKEYDGTVIIVSHDEFFVNSIADRILEIRPGQFRDFPGTLKEYRSYIEDGFITSMESSETAEDKKATASKEERIANREEKKKLERRLQKLEKLIAESEEKVEVLNKELHDPSKANDHQFLVDTHKSIEKLENECAEFMEEWEELGAKLEDN